MFFILVIGRNPHAVRIAAGRPHGDLVIGMDNALAKNDGGKMAFAGCAKTHDEADLAFAKIPLVAMLDDGGIKKRGRLDGVFRGEIGADQQALVG